MKLKTINLNTYYVRENGLISSPTLGEGRMIPALVVSKENDKSLKELINIHLDTPPGDAVVQWGAPFIHYFRPKIWHLHIAFSQPMDYKFEIEFNLEKDYSLIDAIHLSRALYLIYGEKGEKVSQKTDEMILVEIPEMHSDVLWNKTLNNILNRKFKKIGIPKKEIKKEIKNHISNMRKLLLLRKE
ncbi:hypothetical protein [Algibacter lectus]|uniref:Uncharacterized protein n=1 Tax=Algibacter lectus TaxID=221126 RepID=A0A4R8M775_9FLAO|nr:hypothetical protein [Algibacter lectus]MWW26644.1 hypothetical protein [Algibacter lectus]TDY59645.1 hypothetical protein DFQ06_3997 [Algibacter lectus]